jgi:CBS domain-containing protein
MRVADILRSKGTHVVTVAPELSVHQAMRMLARHAIGALIVHDGALLGVLSERDVLRAGAEDLQSLASLRVDELMSSPVVTTTPEMAIREVMDTMTERRIRHLPVTDEKGALCGIVSIGDVVNALRDSIEMENKQLYAYIQGIVQ